MAVTDPQYTAWLKQQNAMRCILIEVIANISGIETTVYLSNVGYRTEFADTPSNEIYLDIVTGGIKFTESLDLESSASLSFGDIEISNHNGIRDSWLDNVWVNRRVQVFLGDVRWDRADFRTIFDGIVEDIDSKKRDVLNIKILDKLQRLNTPVSENTLGGTSINQDVLVPVLLGECFNISPLLTDETTLEYQIHDGAIEDIIEVRDNGSPVLITKDLANGKFTLDENPKGTITVSGQGDKPATYDNTIADLVENLATNYGKASEQFTAGDIDATNFSTFNAANQQPVGIYLSSRENVLTAINSLADSVGAQAVMSRAGQLRLLKIELPPVGVPIEITASDMKENNLYVSSRVPVKSAIKVGFCKNWTVQTDLVTGIPQEHKDFFAEEWVSKTSEDAGVSTTYKLDAEPEQKDTLLLDDTDATTEAARLLTLFKTPRTEYSFSGYANLIELELGDAVTITHSRYGMNGGITGMVVKLQIDWLKFQVKVGVLV